jgi:anti-sigma factor RsiW
MPEATDFEVHLATCPECARELARYREVMSAVGSLRDELEQPPVGFSDRVVTHVLGTDPRWVRRVRRLAYDRRMHVAAASLGGALVGAGAIGLLWWRNARRDVVGSRVAV